MAWVKLKIHPSVFPFLQRLLFLFHGTFPFFLLPHNIRLREAFAHGDRAKWQAALDIERYVCASVPLSHLEGATQFAGSPHDTLAAAFPEVGGDMLCNAQQSHGKLLD